MDIVAEDLAEKAAAITNINTDLSNKATAISTINTSIGTINSDLSNKATAIINTDLSNKATAISNINTDPGTKATKDYVDDKISSVLGEAPPTPVEHLGSAGCSVR